VPAPERVGGPETVTPHAPAFAKPEDRVVVQVFRVVEPAALVEMVTRWTVDRVVLARPPDFRQKLRYDKAIRSVFDVLAIRPPAKVVLKLKVLIRALKKRDILFQKLPGLFIGDLLNVQLFVILVECVHIVFERIRIQDERSFSVTGCNEERQCQSPNNNTLPKVSLAHGHKLHLPFAGGTFRISDLLPAALNDSAML